MANHAENNPVDELFIIPQQKVLEALVYLARAQGLRAGVRPFTSTVQPEDKGVGEEHLIPERTVFIETPEKTMEWPYTEVQAAFLDSFEQYES
jgi:hypothetical protein